ncbi:MAG: sulfur carrier protein ThiS, partial [Sphingomonadales bacterium]
MTKLLEITINGETRKIEKTVSIAALLEELGLDPRKVALERNLEIVPRSVYDQIQVDQGDRLEIVHFIGGGGGEAASVALDENVLTVAGHRLSSRLIVGTGKYKDFEETRRA